jgi:hypothetical protein
MISDRHHGITENLRDSVHLAALLVLLLAGPVRGQDPTPPESPPHEPASTERAPTAGLRVFLDCDRGCDRRYLRQNATFIDYVRDPHDAQVHVLVTRQRTGGGGREYRLEFIGRERFAGIDQVHLFVSLQTDTDDERRRGFRRVLELGLVPYALQEPIGEELEVSHHLPSEGERGGRPRGDDPWNSWLFRADLEGEIGRETRRGDRAVEASFVANRTTHAWKTEFEVDFEYEDTKVELEDDPEFRSSLHDYRVAGQVIKSLGDHWGAGVGGSWGADTYVNLAPSTRAAVAAEYNVFPYDESSQRRLSFAYFLGVNWLHFEERTIFGRTEQTAPDHGLRVVFDMNRPWGRSRLDLEASQLLEDRSKNRLTLRGEIEYRLVKGLSLNFRADGSRIRDQIFLPARDATDEEILLERRALATDFRWEVRFGISFTFGSIYSTVVNARLNGPGRGFNRIPLADD